MRSPGSDQSRPHHPRRDRRRHDPVPHRRAPVLVGEVLPRASSPRRARPRATGPPGTATGTSPGPSARPPSSPAAATPSSASATAGSRDAGARRRPIVAVGRSILVIIWHLLADPEARYNDLGADHFARTVNTDTKKRNHIRQLEALGYTVTLEPAA